MPNLHEIHHLIKLSKHILHSIPCYFSAALSPGLIRNHSPGAKSHGRILLRKLLADVNWTEAYTLTQVNVTEAPNNNSFQEEEEKCTEPGKTVIYHCHVINPSSFLDQRAIVLFCP